MRRDGETGVRTDPPVAALSSDERADGPARADGSISAAGYERLQERYERLRREFVVLADHTARDARTHSGGERLGRGER